MSKDILTGRHLSKEGKGGESHMAMVVEYDSMQRKNSVKSLRLERVFSDWRNSMKVGCGWRNK